MTRYRAAVIGCGRIGDAFADSRATLGVYSHAEAYKTCPLTELVAVCDVDAENLRRCAQRWQVDAQYEEAHELLRAAAPEIVSICTPDETHYTLARAALEAPATRALLVEKPLALHRHEARALVDQARRRGIVLAVNYSRRYARDYSTLRANLAGCLGTVRKVTGYYTKGILHNGTHWIDLCRFLIGEIVWVQGFPTAEPAGADPTPDARIEFASGATGFFSGCEALDFTLFEMDIVTSLGRVRLVDSGRTLEFSMAQESRDISGYRYLGPVTTCPDALRDMTLRAVEDLAACLDVSGRLPICTGEDAIAALDVALAIRASAESGEPTPLVLS